MVRGKIISLVGDEAVLEVDPAKTPKLGETVSIRKKNLGKIVDLIGNVRKPYCVIKVQRKYLASNKKLVGEKIEDD